MKYMQEGEDEVELVDRQGNPEEFSVTRGDDEIVLELFGGSAIGEYYTLTVEEAENLGRSLVYMAKRVRKDGPISLLRTLLDRVAARRKEVAHGL